MLTFSSVRREIQVHEMALPKTISGVDIYFGDAKVHFVRSDCRFVRSAFLLAVLDKSCRHFRRHEDENESLTYEIILLCFGRYAKPAPRGRLRGPERQEDCRPGLTCVGSNDRGKQG